MSVDKETPLKGSLEKAIDIKKLLEADLKICDWCLK